MIKVGWYVTYNGRDGKFFTEETAARQYVAYWEACGYDSLVFEAYIGEDDVMKLCKMVRRTLFF